MKRKLSLLLGAWFLAITSTIVRAQTTADWYMTGANPQRTNWVSEGATQKLYPKWYKSIESFVPAKVQVIAFNDILYIATSRGLYAVRADSTTTGNPGDLVWVFPTDMPLGNSPTIVGNNVYVGGLDHHLYCLNATTGVLIWSFEAEKGFETNPLVVDGTVYAGNRDGYMYAINAGTGILKWKYPTGGPILFSAAINNAKTVIYFASNDALAYALNTDGTLKWKTAKLPGDGFHAYWPVVYLDPNTNKEWVVFPGSLNNRDMTRPPIAMPGGEGPGMNQIFTIELKSVYPFYDQVPDGTLPGPLGQSLGGTTPGTWAVGTPTIDMSLPTTTVSSTTSVTEYFEEPTEAEKTSDPSGGLRYLHKPWRRTFLMLDTANGSEYTSDFDNDGQKEYAPILWQSSYSANRYPPVVGSDKILYTPNNYLSSSYIAWAQVTGWRVGTPYISLPSCDWNAVDEEEVISSGGDMIYYNELEFEAGAMNVKLPNTRFMSRTTVNDGNPTYPHGKTACTSLDGSREWNLYDRNLQTLFPGSGGAEMSSPNKVYDSAEIQNPPIPYKGRLYVIKRNSLLVFGPGQQATGADKGSLMNVAGNNRDVTLPSINQLKATLESEVQKMVTAGHLRTGYHSTGLVDAYVGRWCGGQLGEYWHNPGDTLLSLSRALPYLSPGLQAQTRTYLQTEYQNYPPYSVNHIGWKYGAAREAYVLPEDVTANFQYYDSNNYYLSSDQGFYSSAGGYRYSPYQWYALWKYAQTFNNAATVYNSSKARMQTIYNDQKAGHPADQLLLDEPHVLNEFIAGYTGYLELEKLANQPETTTIKTELTRLIDLRLNNFSKDVPAIYNTDFNYGYCQPLAIARNFMFLVPELADKFRSNPTAYAKVIGALQEYTTIAPQWFISKYDNTISEGNLQLLYDYWALFQAKAQIMKEPRETLAKFLDVPAMAVGDLYYIDNLVSAIEATGSPAPLPGDLTGDGVVDWRDWFAFLPNFGQNRSEYKFIGTGLINIFDVNKLIGLLYK